MLKKIIAMAVSFYTLANAGMIASAESYAETSVVVADTEAFSDSAAVTMLTEEPSKTISEDEEALAEIGKTIRKSLSVTVKDIVIFYDPQRLYDAEGNEYLIDSRSELWIIGIDDVNQRFRVQAPSLTPNGGIATYLTYNDAHNAICLSHDGNIKGDFNADGRVNVFDLIMMRQGCIEGWKDSTTMILADMNDDGQTNVADLVWLQKWLLGAIS